MLIFGRLTWSTVLADYVVHYTVRIGLSINRPLAMATNPSSIRDPDLTRLRRTDKLGGLIHEYELAA